MRFRPASRGMSVPKKMRSQAAKKSRQSRTSRRVLGTPVEPAEAPDATDRASRAARSCGVCWSCVDSYCTIYLDVESITRAVVQLGKHREQGDATFVQIIHVLEHVGRWKDSVNTMEDCASDPFLVVASTLAVAQSSNAIHEIIKKISGEDRQVVRGLS